MDVRYPRRTTSSPSYIARLGRSSLNTRTRRPIPSLRPYSNSPCLTYILDSGLRLNDGLVACTRMTAQWTCGVLAAPPQYSQSLVGAQQVERWNKMANTVAAPFQRHAPSRSVVFRVFRIFNTLRGAYSSCFVPWWFGLLVLGDPNYDSRSGERRSQKCRRCVITPRLSIRFRAFRG